MSVLRPSKAELVQAYGKMVPDVIAPGLKILFCGINPGLYSAAVQHHFARPGNRFWPALHLAGLTPRQLAPAEEQQLLALGFGVTNVVARATAAAAELSRGELEQGQSQLAAKVTIYHPRVLAVLGVSAYRLAFNKPRAEIGFQAETIDDTALWILPNPSGLNAHYQLPDIAMWFQRLYQEIE